MDEVGEDELSNARKELGASSVLGGVLSAIGFLRKARLLSVPWSFLDISSARPPSILTSPAN